jgi:hypothetical protein
VQIPKVNANKQGINKVGKRLVTNTPGRPRYASDPAWSGLRSGRQMSTRDQATEVSSIRKLVPSEESSVPVNVSVTVLPAWAPRENDFNEYEEDLLRLE